MKSTSTVIFEAGVKKFPHERKLDRKKIEKLMLSLKAQQEQISYAARQSDPHGRNGPSTMWNSFDR